MLSSSDIFAALNVSAITSLLDYKTGTTPAMWADSIPQSFTKNKSINFYLTDRIDGGLEYTLQRWTVNCRAATKSEAEAIGTAVFNQINRRSYTDYYLLCSILPVIFPADDTDNYNCVIEVTLKKK